MTLTREQAYNALRRQGMSDADAENYLAWHMLHVDTWHGFQRVALELAERGERIAGKKIGELVRDHLKGCGCDYAVNNNRISGMSRLFAAKYPQYAALFKFRRLGGFDAGRRGEHLTNGGMYEN